MKKLLVILVAIVACSTSALAQEKGDMYVGGYTGVAIQSVGVEGESVAEAAFAIQPEFGYFVADRLKVGASIGYGVSSGTHSFTIAPNVAYYVRMCDGLYYTPGLELGFAMAAMDELSLPGFAMALHLFTLEFRPTEHFGFSANLLSLDFAALSKNGITASTVDFTLGVSPTVGFKYYF